MIVQIGAREGFLRCWTCPNRVDAVLTAAVYRAVAHAFVIGQEEGRSSILEGAAAENVWYKALEIVVAIFHTCGAATRSAAVCATT